MHPEVPPLPATVPIPAGGSRVGYEFDEQQNRVIAQLAGAMQFAGVLFTLFGLASIISGVSLMLTDTVTYGFIGGVMLLNASMHVVVGIALFLAGQAFRRIVKTEGSDLAHLMEALSRLRFSFATLRAVVVAVAIFVPAAWYLIPVLLRR